MAQVTKLELTQRCAALTTQLEAARVLIAEHEGTIAALKAQGAKLQRPQRINTYTPAPPSAEQLAKRAAMAAAKEQAMRSGITTLVA